VACLCSEVEGRGLAPLSFLTLVLSLSTMREFEASEGSAGEACEYRLLKLAVSRLCPYVSIGIAKIRVGLPRMCKATLGTQSSELKCLCCKLASSKLFCHLVRYLALSPMSANHMKQPLQRCSAAISFLCRSRPRPLWLKGSRSGLQRRTSLAVW
jgi:hypothetical protein